MHGCAWVQGAAAAVAHLRRLERVHLVPERDDLFAPPLPVAALLQNLGQGHLLAHLWRGSGAAGEGCGGEGVRGQRERELEGVAGLRCASSEAEMGVRAGCTHV